MPFQTGHLNCDLANCDRCASPDFRRMTGLEAHPIDYDFHRIRAARLRRGAQMQVLRRALRFVRPAVAIAVLAVVLWSMPGRP